MASKAQDQNTDNPIPRSGHRALRIGRRSEQGRLYLVNTVTDKRYPFFTDLFLGRLVVKEMRRLVDERLVDSYAWVLMPDHLHWLFGLKADEGLGRIMKLLKGRSARRINRRLDRQGPVWAGAYYDHALRREEDIRGVARYILGNPLRAGLVGHIGHYPLWDAVWV